MTQDSLRLSGPAIRLEQDGDIAVLMIDNPPVNAGSRAVRAGLLDGLARVAEDDAITGVVLIGANGTFIAGSDIREFGQPLEEPQLPSVIAAIEALPKPVVAAIDGAALGGGYELALGCDARIALAGAVVGLPEVSLGMIPGAGGTQRLPRLTGMATAISLIAGSRRVRADKAHSLSLVDAVVADDLRGAAVRHARGMRGTKHRLRDLAPPADAGDTVAAAEAAALRKGRGLPVREAIDMIRRAADPDIDATLVAERALFQQLRNSERAAALRRLFFAEREAGRYPGLQDAQARDLRSTAVVGAGTMGSGIAATLLSAGYRVVLIDSSSAALDAGLARIRDIEAHNVEAGRVSPQDSQAQLARLETRSDVATLSDVDLAIEAVFEEFDVKRAVLSRLSAAMRPEAIIASNTSYLNLDLLAESIDHAERLVGLHFFAPANVMRLLEIVNTARTAPAVLKTALALAKRLGKVAVIAGVGEGFIGNRIYSAYRRECEFMVEDGASPRQIDAALEAFGFAMGPFAVADLSGLDIAWRNRRRMAASRDPAARYSTLADRLCEAGRFGRKTGAGWYSYTSGGGRGEPDHFVELLIAEVAEAEGIRRRTFDVEEIQMRAVAAMVGEAAAVLKAGIAQRPSDIDLVMVHGYGFPAARGGPLFWAKRLDRATLEHAMAQVFASRGPGEVRPNIDAFLT